MPRRKYLDDVQALRRRDKFPSFDNTAKSDNTRVVPVEKRVQYMKQKNKEQVAKKQARKQRAKQVATKIVDANNPNGVSPWDTKSAMFIANAEAHPEQFEKEYANWYSKVPYDLANTGAQLYDKDNVNLAKAQQNFLENGIWTVGSGFENASRQLNPYIDRDIINGYYNTAAKLPNTVAETMTTIVPFLKNPTKFIKYLGSGYLGSKAVDKAVDSTTKYNSWYDLTHKGWGWDPVVSQITNPGMLAGGYGYNRLSKAWNNPNSLLSQNIRTAFANDKVPYGYNLLDPQNVLPYIKGTYNTIKGKKIPLKPLPYGYEEETATKNNNRFKAWRHYLGVGDDAENLKMVSGYDNATTNRGAYIKRPDGTYDYPFTLDEESVLLPIESPVNKLNSDGSFIVTDFILGNHGNMGGKIKTDTSGNLVAEIVDPFDLNPLEGIGPKWLRPYINLEASKFLPAGAKPFTLKHTIPLQNIKGVRSYGPNYHDVNINTIDDFIDISKHGIFMPK